MILIGFLLVKIFVRYEGIRFSCVIIRTAFGYLFPGSGVQSIGRNGFDIVGRGFFRICPIVSQIGGSSSSEPNTISSFSSNVCASAAKILFLGFEIESFFVGRGSCGGRCWHGYELKILHDEA